MCNMLYATIYCAEMLRAFGQALTPTVRFVYAWFECDRSIIKTILLYLETGHNGAARTRSYQRVISSVIEESDHDRLSFTSGQGKRKLKCLIAKLRLAARNSQNSLSHKNSEKRKPKNKDPCP